MPLMICTEEDAKSLKIVHEYSREEAAKRYTKLLQEYDKDLIAKWQWKIERWGIYTFDKKGNEYLVCIVQTPEGGFRNINRADLRTIAEADLYRKERTYKVIEEIERNNRGLEESRVKSLRSDVEAISKERWRFTVGHPVVQSGAEFN